MSDLLSEKYLLYLRDMSRKVVYGSGSSGNYSQVLIRGSKGKKAKQFQRITSLKLNNIIENYSEGYRRQTDQEKIGNGIFCGVGILSGTYTKKVGSNSALRLIAAPTLYGQLTFEEDGEWEISDWVVNYDIASSLIARNADEEEEAYAAFDPESDKTGNQIIEEIEERLDKLKGNDLTILNQLSQTFLNGFKQLTDTPAEIVETPLESVTAAISARDEKKIKKFFFCPGEWIFFAPIPPGLSTYRALNDLAQEIRL
tara:strand:+ start:109 stop:876 length:768 start_codon:yes stop_codon:yes gene_type:complete